MNNNNTTTNSTTNATNNTEATASVMMPTDELMKLKLAYAEFEKEKVQNRTFGEKMVESLPYVLSGLALGTAGVAVGIAAKSLSTTTKYIESQSYSPSPDGDLE